MIIVFESAAERRNFIRDCERISECREADYVDAALTWLATRHRFFIRQTLERHNDFDVQVGE